MMKKKWETGLASRSVNSRKNETNSSSSFPIEILSHSYNFNPSITQNNLIQGFTYYSYRSYPQNDLPDGGVCSLPKTFVVPAPTGGLANKGSLTHWGRDKMAAVFQTVFSNRFSWMKIYEFRLKFHNFNNIPALLQIMAWRRPGDKPLSELMMVSLLTHICVTQPHWFNAEIISISWRHHAKSEKNCLYAIVCC